MQKASIVRLIILLGLCLVLIACETSSQNNSSPTQAAQSTAIFVPTITRFSVPTSTPEAAAVSMTKNTNCRSGPSTDYPIEVTIPAGSEVVVWGVNPGSDFYYVQNPDQPAKGCWIWGQLASPLANIDILPIFTPPALPKPVIPPTAVLPACERSGTINIKNDTGGQVTLYLTGTASFTFYIAAGNQTLSVCPGSYSYTAYGCGGASRTGSVANGEEIEFWCE